MMNAIKSASALIIRLASSSNLNMGD